MPAHRGKRRDEVGVFNLVAEHSEHHQHGIEALTEIEFANVPLVKNCLLYTSLFDHLVGDASRAEQICKLTMGYLARKIKVAPGAFWPPTVYDALGEGKETIRSNSCLNIPSVTSILGKAVG